MVGEKGWFKGRVGQAACSPRTFMRGNQVDSIEREGRGGEDGGRRREAPAGEGATTSGRKTEPKPNSGGKACPVQPMSDGQVSQ